MKGPLFYSKILLFGEYGIIKDSKGLSIPYNFYNGALKRDHNTSEEAVKSNSHLKSFVAYLENLQQAVLSRTGALTPLRKKLLNNSLLFVGKQLVEVRSMIEKINGGDVETRLNNSDFYDALQTFGDYIMEVIGSLNKPGENKLNDFNAQLAAFENSLWDWENQAEKL